LYYHPDSTISDCHYQIFNHQKTIKIFFSTIRKTIKNYHDSTITLIVLSVIVTIKFFYDQKTIKIFFDCFLIVNENYHDRDYPLIETIMIEIYQNVDS
jgi:hypothetical protein